jgi:hypothetical protein
MTVVPLSVDQPETLVSKPGFCNRFALALGCVQVQAEAQQRPPQMLLVHSWAALHSDMFGFFAVHAPAAQ